ncbi:uncharacterized protein EAF02_003108 [Botrytis sinoallii]|uniref:uncharacterized protein n=1 Tax=Botrytis sinoallii TaxID=1463999 RepID=UPI0019013770|nr:uncharacterized protein EAF02_003108 [Botrytis sinoallii]KAF7888567.1 hypothetical protein EAF02_003108 [Botrytis sinoallii]
MSLLRALERAHNTFLISAKPSLSTFTTDKIRNVFARESHGFLAGKVNQLCGLYGFETVKYFTSPTCENVFLNLTNQEGSDCDVTANMGLKDGCFGIRGCPVFKNRVDLLGRRESKADLFSQVIKWFQDNSAKLPMSYKEEKLYITKIRGHLVSKDRVGVVVSGTTSNSGLPNDIAQLHITDNNTGRGIKRAREEDTDMPDGDVEVPRKLSKQGRKRAARRTNILAIVAGSQDQSTQRSS